MLVTVSCLPIAFCTATTSLFERADDLLQSERLQAFGIQMPKAFAFLPQRLVASCHLLIGMKTSSLTRTEQLAAVKAEIDSRFPVGQTMGKEEFAQFIALSKQQFRLEHPVLTGIFAASPWCLAAALLSILVVSISR